MIEPVRSAIIREWVRLQCTFDKQYRMVCIIGAFTAVIQTLFLREIFSVVGGNELVIGAVLAVWLAATSCGSVAGGRFPFRQPYGVGCFLLIGTPLFLFAIRAVRLFLLPGEAITPLLLLALLAGTVAPVAAGGGYAFGALAGRRHDVLLYRWEQAGSLAGLVMLSIAIAVMLPNFIIAAAVMVPAVLLLERCMWRICALAVPLLVIVSDQTTASWKYPVHVDSVVYAHEGEVATVTVDGNKTVLVNGVLLRTGYPTPLAEQSVHAPLAMRRSARRILLVNDAGQLPEIKKYPGATIDCIRTDRLITDTCCPYTEINKISSIGHYDAVILGCGMPDNIAASRFFTTSFYKRMHQLTGDSGVFSFTLPFQSEFADQRDQAVRDIVVTTLKSVFRNVFIMPGEGLTFIASDVHYLPPDTCAVANDYFQSVILAGCTEKRIREANAEPKMNAVHTISHPQLLAAAAGRYLEMFRVSWWMYVALPFFMAIALLFIPSMRTSAELLSVGSSGFCTGIYSVAILLLFQAWYGTVYAYISILQLALSAGFVAGCIVRRFPFSDIGIGLLFGVTLVTLCFMEYPAPALFFAANFMAGSVAAAQFVTRKKTSTGRLYAADCTGGVIGMALASTLLIPLFGMIKIAAGIAAVKAGVEAVVWYAGKRDVCLKKPDQFSPGQA